MVEVTVTYLGQSHCINPGCLKSDFLFFKNRSIKCDLSIEDLTVLCKHPNFNVEDIDIKYEDDRKYIVTQHEVITVKVNNNTLIVDNVPVYLKFIKEKESE